MYRSRRSVWCSVLVEVNVLYFKDRFLNDVSIIRVQLRKLLDDLFNILPRKRLYSITTVKGAMCAARARN